MIKINKQNIALLYGGCSSEREISLLSGKNVGEALQSKGHNVDFIDTKDKNQLKKLLDNKYDIAFLALHGKGGEDGAMQGFLTTVGLPYTGSKIHASAKAMNKSDSKASYERAGLPTAPYFTAKKTIPYNIDDVIDSAGDDVVVKAAKEGSSIGLYFAKGKEQIQESINKAFEFDDTVVIEKRIIGREFTCATVDFPAEFKEKFKDSVHFSGNLAALPVIEIVPKHEFYDFESKYDEGGSEHICPAKINENLTKKIQDLAIAAHRSLDCSGYSRTDMLVDEDNNVFILETNTLPGMTSKSLVPDAARAIGIEFEELCNLMIQYEIEIK